MNKLLLCNWLCIACAFGLLTAHTSEARLCGKGFFKEEFACIQKILQDKSSVQRHDAIISLSVSLKPSFYESERQQALPLIIETLGDSDAEIRLEALKILVNIYGTEAKPAAEDIRKMLNDPDLRIRLYADAYFKQAAYDESKEICPFRMQQEARFVCLLSAVKNPNVFVRRAALKTLGTGKPPVSQLQVGLPVLIKAIQDSDALVRRHAMYLISCWGDKSVYDQPQIHRAQKDPDKLVRLYAKDCIERTASHIQREANIGSTRQRNFEISGQEMQARHYEDALKTLYSYGCGGRYTGSNLNTLAEYGKQESNNLSLVYRIYDSCPDDLSLRAQSVKTMAAIGEPEKAVPLIISALENAKSLAREAAAESLGKIGAGYPEAIEALIRALTDKDPDVIIASIGALGQLKTNDAAEPVRDIMDNYQTKSSFDRRRVRKAAQQCLKNLSH